MPVLSRRSLYFFVALAASFAPLASKAETRPGDTSRFRSSYISGSDLRTLCAPGQKVKIEFGATTLFVDLWSLRALHVEELESLERGKCPAVPIRARELFFYLPDHPETLRSFVERGLPFHISISNARLVSDPGLPAASPEHRRYLSGGAMIDELTALYAQRWKLGEGERIYRLQHRRSGDGSESAPFRVGCSGDLERTPPRSCMVRYRHGADLVVEYRFSPSGRWISGKRVDWPTTSGTVSEPEGFLEVDQNLRRWLDDLKRP